MVIKRVELIKNGCDPPLGVGGVAFHDALLGDKRDTAEFGHLKCKGKSCHPTADNQKISFYFHMFSTLHEYRSAALTSDA